MQVLCLNANLNNEMKNITLNVKKSKFIIEKNNNFKFNDLYGKNLIKFTDLLNLECRRN